MWLTQFDIYFSYIQFIVYDAAVLNPGSLWEDQHNRQGFARRESAVGFGTLLDYGYANVNIFKGSYVQTNRHERVIVTPFFSPTGVVKVVGPEEWDSINQITLICGNYNLTAAQWVIDDEHEGIDLYFLRILQPATSSAILLADEGLNPDYPLLENVEEAG